MKGRGKEWTRRFFQLENEILVPFLLIGILVIVSFGAISYYNGYTIKIDNEVSFASQMLQDINQDIDYLGRTLGEEALREKYGEYGNPHIAIADADGKPLTGLTYEPGGELRILSDSSENDLGWTIRYLIDDRSFLEELLEEQTYVVIGAIAALLIIIQASIFIAHYISSPIRSMSETCKEIDRNKGNYRNYHFESVRRKDEIGQLASTFQNLLKSMDNYTKIEYTNRMASTLAHEIKNPITGIRSGIQVLRGRAEREGDKMLCDSMIKEIDRVTALITNLFTLSARRESPKARFLLLPVLEQISVLYGNTAGSQPVSFQYSMEKELSCYANENEIKQILHNLISNSIRATEAGDAVEISVTGYGKGRHAVLTLADNGKGMTKEVLDQAMEPFYTKSVNGIGLGLAIVNKLVEQNDGAMEMESAPGAGTKVTLVFHKGEPNEE